jgi:hypothetical protein
MRHPTEGVLRRLVDEPAGVSDADRQHVADCPVCLTGLAAAREDATVVGAALHTDGAADVDPAAAWQRLSTALPARAAAPAAPRRRSGLLRRPARRSPSPSSSAAPVSRRRTTGCRSSAPSRSPRSR